MDERSGVMMKTGELQLTLCPYVTYSVEKEVRNLFGLPVSSWLLQPDGVVIENPLKVLHNWWWTEWFPRSFFLPFFVSSPPSFVTILTLVSFSYLHRITFCHLPFQSKWLYIGTERGNIHIVNVESFMLSGYVIMWNKAIELWVALALFFTPTISPTFFLRCLCLCSPLFSQLLRSSSYC